MTVRTPLFLVICLAVAALVFAGAVAVGNDYVFFAGYVILQYVVLSTAWNILGGYCGYVNFGSAAFFALGAYSTVAMHKLHPLPIPILVLVGGVVSGVVGLGMGYLTLRLRGAFFAIATLALAVVLQTLVVNWDYVGGSRGAYIVRPETLAPFGPYIRYLFTIMLMLAAGAVTVARLIEQGDAQAGEFGAGLVDILHRSGEDDPRALAARRDRTRCAKVGARRHVREVDHDVAELEHDGRTELVLLLAQHLEAEDLLVEGLGLRQVLREDGDDVHFLQRKAHA